MVIVCDNKLARRKLLYGFDSKKASGLIGKAIIRNEGDSESDTGKVNQKIIAV